jgi:hypothetical protein
MATELEKNIECLYSKIASESHLFIIADSIGFFLADALRKNHLSAYDSYSINYERLRIMHVGYQQLSWGQKPSISTCLDFLNGKLLAHVFNDTQAISKLAEYCHQIYAAVKCKRNHYIINNYNDFCGHFVPDRSCLEQLSRIRLIWETLSFDGGPYHPEFFPWDFMSPENILLCEKVPVNFQKSFSNKCIEELYVKLVLFEP